MCRKDGIGADLVKLHSFDYSIECFQSELDKQAIESIKFVKTIADGTQSCYLLYLIL